LRQALNTNSFLYLDRKYAIKILPNMPEFTAWL